MVRVYAKARNNDPTVPYNSRGLSFKSGRGFAVDVRVRDYNGSAAARYAEGVIVGFYESEAEACRVASEINNGTCYPPGHHFHTRAHGAIVVPAWNGPDVPDTLPWETPEGSAEMVAAYKSAGVPIPRWLTRILKRLGSHTEQPDLDGTAEAASTHTRSEPPQFEWTPEIAGHGRLLEGCRDVSDSPVVYVGVQGGGCSAGD